MYQWVTTDYISFLYKKMIEIIYDSYNITGTRAYTFLLKNW